MSGRNFEKDRQRRNVADRGHEHFKGGLPLTGAPRRQISKEQLRLDLDAALASVVQIKRVLCCDGCRHQFTALQPLEPPFPASPCPKCGGDV
ncbi:zinc ribbon domain-containing protein [Rhizobium indicum]|uniref:zinc ribbon domain-containing protein n=1 Tax=Rhizobium indicum TaxID=2583231 RepID=UPI001105C2F6|nr:zinc ribbon domain-containing protein [Rhizobium indicum]QKK28612.1 zinc ribbon domain-containing protein [Rhizobium indicum]